MLTYADAVDRVVAALAEGWQTRRPGSTFYAAPDGFEDDVDFLVPVGDRDAMLVGLTEADDAPAVLVDKATGAVRTVEVIPSLDKIRRMEPVSA